MKSSITTRIKPFLTKRPAPALLATAKVLFPKGAMQPLTIGKKLTTDDARLVRANATRLGEVAAQIPAAPR